MTRKEEIVDAAKKAAEEVYSYTFQGMDDLIGLFKAGAEWADAHPVHYDGKAYLYVLHKGVEQGKKEMLDRVIEWLDNNLCCYIGAQNFTIEHDRLNKDLRKDMGL